MPQTEGSKPTPVPVFNYDLGNGMVVNLAEALPPEDLEPIQKALLEDERAQGAENAVTESEGADNPPAEKEPAKAEEPEKPPEPEPETPKPEALKFKIKRFGQEIDLDLTADQERLKTLVQCGYDYDERRKELDKEKAFIRANRQILESDRFKEFLSNEQSEGRFVPEPPQPVDRTGLTEYAIRKLDPDFDVIREKMAAVAIDLGDDIRSVVDSDHSAFVRLYDRIATDVRTKPAPAPQPAKPTPNADTKVQEKILKSKEVMREKAVIEPPGGGALEAPTEADRWRKRDAVLAKRYKESRSDEDAIALVTHRQYMPR